MRVIWSDEAYNVFEEIVIYLEGHFSEQSARNFERRIEEAKEFIKKQPYAGRPSEVLDVRFWLIDGNRRMYYEVDELNQEIYILDIFDTRQHPSKRKY